MQVLGDLKCSYRFWLQSRMYAHTPEPTATFSDTQKTFWCQKIKEKQKERKPVSVFLEFLSSCFCSRPSSSECKTVLCFRPHSSVGPETLRPPIRCRLQTGRHSYSLMSPLPSYSSGLIQSNDQPTSKEQHQHKKQKQKTRQFPGKWWRFCQTSESVWKQNDN